MQLEKSISEWDGLQVMTAALVTLAVLAVAGSTACSAGSPTPPAHAPDHRWFASAEIAVKHDCHAYGNVHVITTARVLAAQWTTASQYGSGYGWFAHLQRSSQGYRVTDCHDGGFAPHH